MEYNITQGDVIEWATNYTGPKFHAALLDPPYHLTIVKRFGKNGSAPAKGGVYNRSSKGFMGQSWDGGDLAFNPETWAALAEHLYPGAFTMAFAGTRGYHRMACAMEDAGLVIHPAAGWCQLSGFPKATRVDIQCEQKLCYCVKDEGGKHWYYKTDNKPIRTEPPFRSEMANTWSTHRYGLQALKPAFEFIAVAQKPYEGRPVDNITETGAGALWIGGGRVGVNPGKTTTGKERKTYGDLSYTAGETWEGNDLGRWPANLILDESGSEMLDRQSGVLTSGGSAGMRNRLETGSVEFSGLKPKFYPKGDGVPPDSGGASRMFYQTDWQYEILEQLSASDPLIYEPKVSTAEREAGLTEFEAKTRNRVNSGGYERDPKFAPTQMKNTHPTLKPIKLTKYLATLLLPPAEYGPRRILVPFAGAGSEMIGAILAGWEEVAGIEQSPDYARIAEARLAWWSQWPGWGQTDVETILKAGQPENCNQLSLF